MVRSNIESNNYSIFHCQFGDSMNCAMHLIQIDNDRSCLEMNLKFS